MNMKSATLRRATFEDAHLLFDWVNDEDTRKNAIHTDTVTWETHCKWLTLQLEKPDSTLYILEEAGLHIGQIRLDKKDGFLEISYSIAKSFRGKGWGKHLVSMVISKWPESTFRAIVRKENIASVQIFRALNFKETYDQNLSENFLIFVRG